MLLEKICGEDDIVYPILEEEDENCTYRSRNYGGLGIEKHGNLALAKEIVGPRLFKKYYKFTTVRNPWDKEVSGYQWKMSRWGKSCGFRYYLATNKFSNFEPYYKLKGVEVADRIMRFENLEEDTKKVFNDLGIKTDLEYPKAKTGINPKDKVHYSSYYSDRLRLYVYKKYKNDIKRFNYGFDNVAMKEG
jgi:hypothetical protein